MTQQPPNDYDKFHLTSDMRRSPFGWYLDVLKRGESHFQSFTPVDIQPFQFKEWLMGFVKFFINVPIYPLNYKPDTPNKFSLVGEKIVDKLIEVGPLVTTAFANRYLNKEEQARLLQTLFGHKAKSPESKPGKKGGKGYYQVDRQFSTMIPEGYRRSRAPRLTTGGNTFHGMNKAFLVHVLETLTLFKRNILIAEVDLSACHTRIAAGLLPPGNQLEQSLTSDTFWADQINKVRDKLEPLDSRFTPKVIKKMMKVFLYASLNGGTPAGDKNLEKNITDNANWILSLPEEKQAEIMKALQQIGSTWSPITEVKNLSSQSFGYLAGDNIVKVHTLERTEPYVLSKDDSYKSISRVLQSQELLLLSNLIAVVGLLRGLPLSLDHDGALILFEVKEPVSDVTKVREELELLLSHGMKEFSNYLLKAPFPVEVKRIVYHGKHYES